MNFVHFFDEGANSVRSPKNREHHGWLDAVSFVQFWRVRRSLHFPSRDPSWFGHQARSVQVRFSVGKFTRRCYLFVACCRSQRSGCFVRWAQYHCRYYDYTTQNYGPSASIAARSRAGRDTFFLEIDFFTFFDDENEQSINYSIYTSWREWACMYNWQVVPLKNDERAWRLRILAFPIEFILYCIVKIQCATVLIERFSIMMSKYHK